jgi:LacI family transcriptional regulator
MKPRVTLADLARELGVTKSAVCFALNDRPHVSEALRARAKTLAQKLGYRRDPALSLIAASRWRQPQASPGSVLAFISNPREKKTAAAKRKERTGSLGPDWQAAQQRAVELGYRPEIFYTTDYPSAESMSAVLKNRGIRGVVFFQIYDSAIVEQFDWDSFCSVAIHDGYLQPPVELFTPNYVQALQECWTRALAAGYRRPGLALFHEMREHYINFIVPAAAARLALALPPRDRVPFFHLKIDDKAALAAWVKKHRPDVVIGFNDTHYWALRELGVSIPDDVAYLSILRAEARAPDYPVAGVGGGWLSIGRHAIERLDTLLRHDTYGRARPHVMHRIVGEWLDAASLPPARPARPVRISPDTRSTLPSPPVNS